MVWDNSSGNSPASPPGLPNDEIETIASTVVYLLLDLMIVIGNSLVIAAYCHNARLQTITNAFLVGLAVSDLLVGLISVPLWIYFSNCQQYNTCLNSKGLRVLYPTLDVFAGSASILQLTAISIERFIAITRPIRHRNYPTRFYNGMIVMAWVYALVIAGLYPVQVTRWMKIYTIIQVSTCLALPTIIIIVVYVKIFNTARAASKNRVQPESFPKRHVQQETKIAVTIAVVTGLFVLAWTPFFVVNVVATFDFQALPPYPGLLRLIRFIKWMHYSNSIMNPCVYAYRNKEMRRTFIKLISSVFNCCQSNEYPTGPPSVRAAPSRKKVGFHSNTPSGKSDNQNEGFEDDVGPSGIEEGDYACASAPNTTNFMISSPTFKDCDDEDPRSSPEGAPLEKGPTRFQPNEAGPDFSESSPQIVSPRVDKPGAVSEVSISDQGTQSQRSSIKQQGLEGFKGVVSICEDEESEIKWEEVNAKNNLPRRPKSKSLV